MRALVVEELAAEYAGCMVKDIPTPDPKPGEVLIQVKASAVNFPDLMQTRGEHQHKPQVPFTPGMELAGEIVKLGEGVEGWKVGDAVAGGSRTGGMAQYAVSPAAALHRMPATLSFGQAAGYQVAYLTAYVALVRRAQVEPGQWVLVHGAAGGVGLACVDMARMLGCKVIAASASDDKLAIIQKEYAPDAIVNVSHGFKDRVKEITGGRGADVIYDPVGGDVFDESVRCIAFNGAILSIGFTSGRLPVLPVNYALIKGFSVMGVRAGEYGRQFPQKGRENNEAIWKMAQEGLVKPRVHEEYPLDGWRAAFDTLADRKVVGKTVVRPDL
jgi:NADPH2:quinone reductase